MDTCWIKPSFFSSLFLNAEKTTICPWAWVYIYMHGNKGSPWQYKKFSSLIFFMLLYTILILNMEKSMEILLFCIQSFESEKTGIWYVYICTVVNVCCHSCVHTNIKLVYICHDNFESEHPFSSFITDENVLCHL